MARPPRSSFWLVRLALLLNLAFAWSAGAATLTSPAAGPGGPEILPAATFHTSDPWVFLRWQARAVDSEGTFQLYRGDSPSTLQEIGEAESYAGVGTYRFFDARPLLGHALYQLRFRSPFGDEVVLATISCERHQDASSQPALQGSSLGAVAILPPGLELADPALVVSSLVQSQRPPAGQLAIEPFEPPPDHG
jgi:hypothetical protein